MARNPYPGQYSVVGSSFPGSIVPGTPLLFGVGLAYAGYETVEMLNATPTEGGALVLVPGQAYDISSVIPFQLRGHPYFGVYDFTVGIPDLAGDVCVGNRTDLYQPCGNERYFRWHDSSSLRHARNVDSALVHRVPGRFDRLDSVPHR